MTRRDDIGRILALSLLLLCAFGAMELRAANDEALWGRVVWADGAEHADGAHVVASRLGARRQVVPIDEKGFFRIGDFAAGSWRLALESNRRELISFPVEAAEGDHYTVRVAVEAPDASGLPQVEATVMRDNLVASATPFLTVYRNEDEAMAHLNDGTLVVCSLGEKGQSEVPELPERLFEDDATGIAELLPPVEEDGEGAEGPWTELDTPDRPDWRSEAVRPASLLPMEGGILVDPDVKVSTLDADPILSGIDPDGALGMI